MPKHSIFKTDLNADELLSWLKGEAIVGMCHLEIADGLLNAKVAEGKVAPQFFALTVDAHLQAAQLYAAKLFDKAKGHVTLHTLLEKAEASPIQFPKSSPQEIRKIVESANVMIDEVEPTLKVLRDRRNEYIAHLAPSTVRDVSSLNSRGGFSVTALRDVFLQATNILNLFSSALNRTLSAPLTPSCHDYEDLLNLIEKSDVE